ncbi:unnamed protein product [Arabidopsis lyrata]|uniref:Expressed protein n=1 Tax=Arabidopsis lyrata subsp. lyrata TaxID=81972 RepID=D7MT44_ARALL|nr:expressed protein [Arabidopsis lyrata subsp. lyrata]CAH8280288.1 unnamed protein product [Arabidopsis lyrata]
MDLLGEAAVWLRRWSTSPQRVVVGCPRSVGCSVLVSLGDDSGSLLISRSGGSWIRGRCLVCFSSPVSQPSSCLG